MMTPSHPLLSLWTQPRQTIQRLNQSFTPFKDFRYTTWLTVATLIQIVLFIITNNTIPLSAFVSAEGLQAMGWGVIALFVGLYTYANLTALMSWKLAAWLGGSASVLQTRTALIWGMFAFLPTGINLALIHFAYTLKLMGHPIYLLGPLSLITLPFVLIWSFILALKIFSEMHRFSIWRAFIVLIICLAVQGAFLYLLFIAIRAEIRSTE